MKGVADLISYFETYYTSIQSLYKILYNEDGNDRMCKESISGLIDRQ